MRLLKSYLNNKEMLNLYQVSFFLLLAIACLFIDMKMELNIFSGYQWHLILGVTCILVLLFLLGFLSLPVPSSKKITSFNKRLFYVQFFTSLDQSFNVNRLYWAFGLKNYLIAIEKNLLSLQKRSS